MVWHWDGLLRATARPATAVLGGLTFCITPGNKGNKSYFVVYMNKHLGRNPFWTNSVFNSG